MGFLENLELRILDLGNSLTWVPTILVRFGSFWFAEAALLVRFGSLLVRSWFAQKAKKIRFFEGLRNPGSLWFAFGSLRLRSWFALVRSWFAAVPLRFRS